MRWVVSITIVYIILLWKIKVSTPKKKSTVDVYGFMTGNDDRISLRKACRDTETA